MTEKTSHATLTEAESAADSMDFMQALLAAYTPCNDNYIFRGDRDLTAKTL